MLVDDAAGAVMGLTGRAIGVEPGGEGPFGCVLVEVPVALTALALRILTTFVERFHVANPSAAERLRIIKRQQAGLASFSAGPYSESYFSPGDAVTNQSLDADPMIHRDLWGLATECVRLYWQRLWDPSLPLPPASAVMSFDWTGDLEMDLRGAGFGPWWP